MTSPAAPPPSDLDTWLARLGPGEASLPRILSILGRGVRHIGARLAASPILESAGRDLLDPPAVEALARDLAGSGAAWLAINGRESALALDPGGDVALVLASTGGDLAPGLLFGLFPAAPEGAAASLLQRGDRLLVAGYAVFGAATSFGVAGLDGLTLFRCAGEGGFVLESAAARLPTEPRRIALDMTAYRFWHHPVRLLADDAMAGAEGPRGLDYELTSPLPLAAEVQRLVAAGGVAILPPDHRQGRQSGACRLVFEAFPVAWILEAAGGAASDTHRRILSRIPTDLRQTTPLVAGATDLVKLVDAYHLGPSARVGEASPLFGRRGLFRK